MREVERLSSEVASTMAGDPWYGTSLHAILDGVDATGAASRPIPGAHSIWELVLHMTAWTREATRRLRGEPHGTPAEGDWPAVTGLDTPAWNATVTNLRRAHDELAQALLECDDSRMTQQTGAQADSQGRTLTHHRTMIGLLQHDAYHGGQIALLKKILTA